jgi:acylneuraminate cytidylyltransferase
MYKNKSIMALIPARGGSKGIKNKNIAELCGKPLIAYTIQAALEAACFDDIIVSTDSEKIAEIARSFEASTPFLRPLELAQDETKGEAVLKHALSYMNAHGRHYDVIVSLQPTSPLRSAKHILEALDFFIDHDLPSLTSISLVSEHPLFMRTIDETGFLTKVISQPSNVRRQDLCPYYTLNGAIYINKPEDIINEYPGNENNYGYIMDYKYSIDINTVDDLKKAEDMLMEFKKKA